MLFFTFVGLEVRRYSIVVIHPPGIMFSSMIRRRNVLQYLVTHPFYWPSFSNFANS